MKKILSCLFCIGFSINSFSQDVCSSCDTLPLPYSHNLSFCYEIDFVEFLEGVNMIEKKHICKDYKEVDLIRIGNRNPYTKMQISNNDTIFTLLDTIAFFPKGGESAMKKFFRSNLEFPEEAKEKKLKGTVYVSFVVTQTGEITDITLVRGIHPLLDKEALRLIALMPEWESAVFNGKKVKNKITVPVNLPK